MQKLSLLYAYKVLVQNGPENGRVQSWRKLYWLACVKGLQFYI